MKKCYIPIGIPGAGKSYLAKRMKVISDLIIVSPDEIRFKILNSETTKIYYDPEIEAQVWSQAYSDLRSALASQIDVFFDATNMKSARRKTIAKFAQDNLYRVIYINLTELIEFAFEQNKKRERIVCENVLYQMVKDYEPLKQEECMTMIPPWVRTFKRKIDTFVDEELKAFLLLD